MAIPAIRTISTTEVRSLGSLKSHFQISDLTEIQVNSYIRFLQLEEDPRERKDSGLEAILRVVHIWPVR